MFSWFKGKISKVFNKEESESGANDDSSTSIFGNGLSKRLENRILEYLDRDSASSSRLVNSKWRSAIDSLQHLWSGLAGRLSKTDTSVTCGFCRLVYEEPDIPDVDLKLAAVRVDEDFERLYVTAFDPNRAVYYKWQVQVSMDADPQMRLAEKGKMVLNRCADWYCLLRILVLDTNTGKAPSINDILDPSHSIFKSRNSDQQQPAEAPPIASNEFPYSENEVNFDIDDSLQVDFTQSDWNTGSRENDGQKVNQETQEAHLIQEAISSEPIRKISFDFLNAFDSSLDSKKVAGLTAACVDRQQAHPGAGKQLLTSSHFVNYYAVVPLRGLQGHVAIPHRIICVPIFEPGLRVVFVRKCRSCSDTQVVVLTRNSLLLYLLQQPVTVATGPFSLSFIKPRVLIELTAPLVELTPESHGSGPSQICEITSRSNQARSSDFFIIFGAYNTLHLFQVDCRSLRQLNSLKLPESHMTSFAFDPSTRAFVLYQCHRLVRPMRKLRIVQPFLSSNGLLELDYGPCEYYNPLEPGRLPLKRFDFQIGRQLWFCLGKLDHGTSIAIFRIGFAKPLIVLEINDVVPLTCWDRSHKAVFLAANWVHSGFSCAGQTPLVSLLCNGTAHLLLSWSFSPPGRGLHTRVALSRDFVRDLPWIRGGSGP